MTTDSDQCVPEIIQKPKCASRKLEQSVNRRRARLLNKAVDNLAALDNLELDADSASSVLYWMEREVRVFDNWALLYAQEIAKKNNINFHVVYSYPTKYREETVERKELFKLKGVEVVEKILKTRGIPFHFFSGCDTPQEAVIELSKKINACCVVTDFHPFREKLAWRKDLAQRLTDIPVVEIDAHNVVPVWIASDKLEVGARTIRSKITNKYPDFLTEFPTVVKQDISQISPKRIPAPVDWETIYKTIDCDRSVKEVEWRVPGEMAAMEALTSFIQSKKFKNYALLRNDPNEDLTSKLSPYFRHGQLSAQRSFLVAQAHALKAPESVKSFVEESVVRRELSDNFCYYSKNYDNIEGSAGWAKESLDVHKKDIRSICYTADEFENAKSHDDLWNAAQLQLKQEGRMHGFMRMYWAKKILEWSSNPEDALSTSIYLNDKFALDGYDPNGMVGCMWSICGTHDQGWKEREVFGKIRYMNYAGCKRKFDVAMFVSKYPQARTNAEQCWARMEKAGKVELVAEIKKLTAVLKPRRKVAVSGAGVGVQKKSSKFAKLRVR